MDTTGQQITNVGEHGQTKLEFYDDKLRYQNLKNEVKNLTNKMKIVEKHNVPQEEREAIMNDLTKKQTDLKQAKAAYKQRRNNMLKDVFHRSN